MSVLTFDESMCSMIRHRLEERIQEAVGKISLEVMEEARHAVEVRGIFDHATSRITFQVNFVSPWKGEGK
jgi:hypothetical protein